MLTTTQSPLNLGQVQFGKPIDFSFEVRNTGNRPLQITKLWVGCASCTTARVSKAMLAENECAQVNVTFTPGSIGTQNKTVQIQWDGNKVLKLEFTAISHE